MAVSVKDVAALAHVSVGTVSNVLNRPDTVSPAMADRVKQAIRELRYVPNDAARQLRMGQSTVVAFIVHDAGNPFFTDVLSSAETAAHEHGYTVLMANSGLDQEREAAHLGQFERQRVAGMLIVPAGDPSLAIDRMRARDIPVVLVDRVTDDPSVASVASDDRLGGALAAEHLVALGRRRLVFVGSARSLVAIDHRVQGAREVTRRAGLDLIQLETPSLTLESGVSSGARVAAMVRSGDCDAVIAANDLIAIGLEKALLSGPRPLSIPEDVALVGYDDISFAAASVVPITSVRQPRAEMGRIAVDLLLREAALDGGAVREHVVLAPTLVVRASTDPNAPGPSSVTSA
ncbi:LacI family transcriptional regulator [Demequina activiva]|uniref:LacI family transcriptional regulator n=1 Tax=Demequina activiva TaxID=1582364 RepID=A0A919UKM8_9MICO|nr:LacI family transcriptional regulator [Demequina activiva]